MRALMCVGAWSAVGLVKNSDIKAVLGDEIDGMEFELSLIWDAIKL
jgi:hypothetical protein